MPTSQENFILFAKKENTITDIHHAYQLDRANIRLEAPDGKNQSLIDYSASRGHIDVIIWLALAGIATDVQTSADKSPLYRAIEHQQRNAAILLLLLGANVNAKTTGKGYTPLKVERYTVEPGIGNIVSLISELDREATAISTQPKGAAAVRLPLSAYPHWQQEAPMLIGRIKEVSELTWHTNLQEFYATHPLLNAILLLIEANEAAKAIAADAVVHISPVKQAPVAGRAVDSQYGLTPGLAMPPEIKVKMQEGVKPEERITLSQSEIIYHAKLRLQFAFYLLVTYYQTRINLTFTATKDQEGQGEASIQTVGCHSALINDVSENFRWKPGVTVTESIHTHRSNSEPLASPHLSSQSFFSTLLRKTTVELHTAVNQYDTELEGKKTLETAKPARRELFKLLNKTSLGELNPIQALEQFLISLVKQNGIFDGIEARYVQSSKPTSPSCMRQIIHAYVFEATAELLNAERTHVKRTFIADLLFASKDQRKGITECREEELAAQCEPLLHELQREIITNRL